MSMRLVDRRQHHFDTYRVAERILADGGAANDLGWMDNIIRGLTALGQYGRTVSYDVNAAHFTGLTDDVEKIYDLSVQDHDLTQGTATAQPALVRAGSALNERLVARFDGTAEHMSAADHSIFTSSNGHTIFLVAKYESTTGEGPLTVVRDRDTGALGTASGFGLELETEGYSTGNTVYEDSSGDATTDNNSITIQNAGTHPTGFFLQEVVYEENKITVIEDGTDQQLGTVTNTGSAPIGEVNGSTLRVATADGTTRMLQMDLAHLTVVGKALTQSVRQDFCTILKAYYLT